MRFLYKENTAQYFFNLLKFYWAFCWREAIFWSVCILPIILFIACDWYPSTLALLFDNEGFFLKFGYLLIASFFVTPLTLKWSLFKQYRTFKVNWHIEISKNTFLKTLFIPIGLYNLIVCGLSLLFNYLGFNYYLAVEALIDQLIGIFFMHLFIINKWLPFSLITLIKNKQEKK